MHVYGCDINDLDNLTQDDKEETDRSHSSHRVQKMERIPQKCMGNNDVLSKKEMIKELKKLKLNSSGSPKVLHKRLDMYYSKTNPCTTGDGGRKNMFDFYVVIDFEATCDNQKRITGDNQEIIEFPAILLNCKNGKLEDEFQSYCRPTLHPIITEYCTKLTGITQDVVNKAPLFQQVFASFNDWLQKKKLGSKFSFAVVTDGSKDMGHFLKTQCELSNIIFPDYGKHWINIRKMFSKFYKIDIQHRARVNNDTVLNTMILEIGSKFKGRAHSGLDDARNIAIIVQRLLEDGASLILNEKLPEESADNNNDKRLFASPVLQSEFGSIKGNFPSEHRLTDAIEETRMTETANKSCATRASATLREETPKEKILNTATKKTPATTSGKKGSKLAQTAPLPKENVGKNRINGAIPKTESEAASSANKNQAKKSPSIAVSENAGKKCKEQRPVKVCPAQAAVKGINGNTLVKISLTSKHEKSAEVLAKELKLAKKEFYMKVQQGTLTKDLRAAKKKMEVLKKCLKAAQSKETACVSKPPIEDKATARRSNVAEEQQAVGASGKGACNSQEMAKKKVSTGKKGKKSESKGSLGTALHDMKPTIHVGTTANVCVQDVNLTTARELLFDKAKEELFFHRFKMTLNTRTSSDREGKEDN